MHSLVDLIDLILHLYSWVIIATVIASWLVVLRILDTSSYFVQRIFYILERLTQPVYDLIRRVIPHVGGLDFSPLIVLLSIYFLRRLLREFLYF